MYCIRIGCIQDVLQMYPVVIPILIKSSSALWGVRGMGNSFLTIKITFENVLYPYPVYSVYILGVFYSNSNFDPIKLCFMTNIGFSWSEKLFLIFRITFQNVFIPYSMYSGCIQGVFFAKNLLKISSFSVAKVNSKISSFSGAEILMETLKYLSKNLLKMISFSVLEIC